MKVIISNSSLILLTVLLILIGSALLAERIRYGILLLLIGVVLLIKISRTYNSKAHKDETKINVNEDDEIW